MEENRQAAIALARHARAAYERQEARITDWLAACQTTAQLVTKWVAEGEAIRAEIRQAQAQITDILQNLRDAVDPGQQADPDPDPDGWWKGEGNP